MSSVADCQQNEAPSLSRADPTGACGRQSRSRASATRRPLARPPASRASRAARWPSAPGNRPGHCRRRAAGSPPRTARQGPRAAPPDGHPSRGPGRCAGRCRGCGPPSPCRPALGAYRPAPGSAARSSARAPERRSPPRPSSRPRVGPSRNLPVRLPRPYRSEKASSATHVVVFYDLNGFDLEPRSVDEAVELVVAVAAGQAGLRDQASRPEQLPRPPEHPVQHRLGQASGLRILLTDVIGGEQGPAVGEGCLGGVGEAGSGADGTEVAQGGVPGVAAEGDDDANGVEKRELALQPWGAVVPLSGERLVVRGCALDRGGDVAVDEGQAVVAGDRGGLVGEAGAPEGGEQPVAGAVAAVGGGGQAEDEQPGVGIAEAGDGTPPILLVTEGGALLAGHALAPVDQARAAPALDHLPVEPLELFVRHHRLPLSGGPAAAR